ncbi:MAG: FAD-dependent oxidoreductase, partial [Alphaproteobacteria bacterium]
GIYFIGLPWLSTWGSGRFGAVGRDAEHVVQAIQQRLGTERFALKFAV